MTTLILAEHDRDRLDPSLAHCVAAAGALGDDIHILVAAPEPDELAKKAATIAGVTKVLAAKADAHADAAALTALVLPLAANYAQIVAAASAFGRDLIPHLAARLDIMPVTDIIAIHGPQTFDRPVYAGNAIETVTSAQTPNLLTFRASAFARAGDGGGADIEAVATPQTASAAKFIAELRTQSDTPDLGSARIVVAGGVSFGSAEKFKLVSDLADLLGAAVGATRAAVDAGLAPNDWQVGQTGKIVAPDLYIGVGISGALQHLAGIQGAKKIIAINSDPEAPLMKIADIALVGDLFEVVPALIAELTALQA